MRIDVLGVGFDNVTLEGAVAAAGEMLAEGGFHYAVTPNAEFVQRAEKDEAFRTALNKADLVLPDGIGVVHAAKILGRPLQGRVPGCDFAAALAGQLAKTGGRLFLLGAKPGVAEQAARNLQASHPGLTVCGTHDGYFTDDGAVVEQIRAGRGGRGLCLSGGPQAGVLDDPARPDTGASLLIGLGGSLDGVRGHGKAGARRLAEAGAGVALPAAHAAQPGGTYGKTAPVFGVGGPGQGKGALKKWEN